MAAQRAHQPQCCLRRCLRSGDGLHKRSDGGDGREGEGEFFALALFLGEKYLMETCGNAAQEHRFPPTEVLPGRPGRKVLEKEGRGYCLSLRSQGWGGGTSSKPFLPSYPIPSCGKSQQLSHKSLSPPPENLRVSKEIQQHGTRV